MKTANFKDWNLDSLDKTFELSQILQDECEVFQQWNALSKDMSIDEIFTEIKKYNCNLVEVTGGEPLMQNESFDLMTQLCNSGYSVMLETGGSLPIINVDQRVKIILDLKCPSSGMEKKNDYSNIDFIKQSDEIKFVIGNKEDFDWSKEIVKQYNLDSKCVQQKYCRYNRKTKRLLFVGCYFKESLTNWEALYVLARFVPLVRRILPFFTA